MENKVEYVLDATGKITRRVTNEAEIHVSDELMSSLSGNIIRKQRRIMEVLPGVMAHVSFGNGWALWSMEIAKIPMRCPFHMVDKMLVPNLSSETDEILELTWTPPASMRLRYGVWIEPYDARDMFQASYSYLVAYDERGQSYKLPLGNLYDDCRLCTGKYENRSNNHVKLIHNSLKQFEQGLWNADLWKNPEQTQRMFRFKPKDEGFAVLPIDGNWTSLCNKASTETLGWMIV